MKNTIYGILIGILLAIIGQMLLCKNNPSSGKVVETITYDTIYVDKIVKIPEPVIRYVSKTEWKEITKEIPYLVEITDTLFVDTTRQLPIHTYVDSLEESDIKLNWEIETYGYLLKFHPKIQDRRTIKQVTTYVPENKNWQVGLGVSNQMNTKIMAGYKGWNIEPVFNANSNFKFEELYISKTFKF